MARASERIEFVGVFAGDDSDAGEDTPVGFRDGLCATAPRKRGTTAIEGEATLRDSQATQAQTETATELVTQVADDTTTPPVFVYAPTSLGDVKGSYFRQYQQPPAEEIDEDETQIVMSLSQDQFGLRAMRAAAQRKIDEEEFAVAKPTPPALDVIHSASEDDGADSDMSDDMLAHDGPHDSISALAASLQQQDADADEPTKKRASAHVYRPRTHFRHAPTFSVDVDADASSSGAETEVEAEPESRSDAVKQVSAVDLAEPKPMRQQTADASTTSEREPESAAPMTSRKPFRLASSSSNNSLLRRMSERSDSTASDSTAADGDASEAAADPNTAEPAAHDRSSSHKNGSISNTSNSVDANARVRSSSSHITRLPPSASPTDAAALTTTNGRKRKLTGATTVATALPVAPREIRIVLTGIEPTPSVRKKIRALGSNAAYEDDVERATHVVAPHGQLKRTVKLLCGISRCDHIVDAKWLDDSARAGAPLREQDYCLLDPAAQTKWRFDLHKTMYDVALAQRQQLFAGRTVFITSHKSVLPPVKDLVKIVECAGGRAETKGSASATDLVVTTDAALALASVQKALVAADPQRIYSPELVLTSILQQHIDLDAHRLALAVATGGAKKRGRK